MMLPASVSAGSALPRASSICAMSIRPSSRTSVTRDLIIFVAGRSGAISPPSAILRYPPQMPCKPVQRELAGKKLSLMSGIAIGRGGRSMISSVEPGSGTREMKAECYPRTDKAKAVRAWLSRSTIGALAGSTVDLGIVPPVFHRRRRRIPRRRSSHAPHRRARGSRRNDRSWYRLRLSGWARKLRQTRASRDSAAQPSMPQILHAGSRLRPYAREWWHFQLVNEPFDHGFDFEVRPRPSSNERPTR